MAEQTPGRGSITTTALRRPAQHGAGIDSGRLFDRLPRQMPVVLPLLRAASRRALLIALAIATLLHLPFLPTPLLSWLELALQLGDVEIADYDAGETIIPLDLDLAADEPSAVAQAPAAPEPQAAAPAAPPAPAPTITAKANDGPRASDAGAPAAPQATVHDAGVGDAGAAEDNGQPKIRDPLSVAGAPGKLAAKDPNVQVLIAGDRIRKHELGEWFGRILTTIPQWQSFFEGTSIDPIRDIDHLLIAGPQFRDSSKVVAVMDYRAPEAAMREAIDVIVQRAGGAWLEGAPVPTARARADRSERLFALVPDKRLLVVLPVDQEDQLAKLKAMKPFNRSSTAGIVISMLTPANAFRGIYALSPSLAWLRLTVTPTKDGGADLALTLGDASEEETATHAAEFTKIVNAVRTVDLGIAKIEALDEVTFNADGKIIWARVHVTSKQLKLIMGFVEQALKDQAEARNGRKTP